MLSASISAAMSESVGEMSRGILSMPMRCASLTNVLDSVACSLISTCSPLASLTFQLFGEHSGGGEAAD